MTGAETRPGTRQGTHRGTRPDDRPEIAASGLVRPVWRRTRYWVAAVVVVLVAAVLVGTLANSPGRALDPGSSAQNGSRALSRVLAGYGVAVHRTTRVADAVVGAGRSTVLITSPDDYSDRQLRRLVAAAARVVLVEPGLRALRATTDGVEPNADGTADPSPGCSDAGARAAGDLDLPGAGTVYTGGGAVSCWGGLVVLAPHVAVLGSGDLLRNDELSHEGVAALDVNVVTASRTTPGLVWLLPGPDAAGSGPASIWDLFPGGAYRVFWWLFAVGALVVLWRARRLGGVVAEPLPVIVRAAEVVEGHGRLYLRAGATDRAAAALRAAAAGRLAARLGLPRGSTPTAVAAVVAPLVGRAPADVHDLLAGAAPGDDTALVRLATELDRLEASVGTAGDAATKGTR